MGQKMIWKPAFVQWTKELKYLIYLNEWTLIMKFSCHSYINFTKETSKNDCNSFVPSMPSKGQTVNVIYWETVADISNMTVI